MKKVFLFFLFVSCFSLIAAAENDNTVKERSSLPGYRTNFQANPFGHNWFISANFGANSLLAEHVKHHKASSITFMPVLSVGKWFNPWLGVRLQGGGGALHGFNSDKSMQHLNYVHAHLDVMVGLFNFFGKYREDRKFDLIPYLGIGGLSEGGIKNHDNQSFTLNGGIQARYTLSPRFDINLEFNGLITDDDLVTVGDCPNDGIVGLSAGVTYRFKHREFHTAPSHAELAYLADMNNDLKDQIKELENRPAETKIVEKIIEKEVPGTVTLKDRTLYVIPFKLARHEIEDVHGPILYNISQFMKENPDIKIVVRGCADKIGNKAMNDRLSKDRAYSVAKYLQQKYGISEDRMVVKYTGNENPFFKEDDTWNRCVIIKIAK